MQPPVVFRQERDVAGGGGAPQQGAVEQEPVARPTGRKPTEFDKTRDREFAKNITDWTLGGQQTAYTNLQALAGVIEELESGEKNLTGPVVGSLPWRSVTAPASRDAEDRVGRVVQQSLKAILGGQFAEREAQDLLSRSYNTRLQEGFNADRLRLLYNDLVMRAQMNDKAADYLKEHGLLDGFDGTIPELSEMQLYGTANNSLKDVMGSAKQAAEQHGWSESSGLSSDEESRYQELLRKQAEGTLE